MAKDAYYEGTREVRTFVDLNHGADLLLGMAQETEAGSYYTTMASLLLTAFTFEAYLNHLGQKTLPFWDNVESLRVADKFELLCKTLDIVPGFGKRPYQTLRDLFKFRNAIAHGKSEILKEQKKVSSESNPSDHMPRAHWEEHSTISNAERAREDISEIIKELHIAAGLGNYPFVGAAAISSLSVKPKEQSNDPGA